MRYVIGVPFLAFVAFLAYAAITGRAKARSCCSVEASEDARLREN